MQTNSGHRQRRLDPARSVRRHQRTTRISGHRARGSGLVLIRRRVMSAATPPATASAPGMLPRMLQGPLSGRKCHVLVANTSAIGPARGLPRPTRVTERGLTAPHGGRDAMAKRTRGLSAVAAAAGGGHMAGAGVRRARRCRRWSTCTASCRSACRRRRHSRWPPSPVTATSLGADQAPPRPHGQYCSRTWTSDQSTVQRIANRVFAACGWRRWCSCNVLSSCLLGCFARGQMRSWGACGQHRAEHSGVFGVLCVTRIKGCCVS